MKPKNSDAQLEIFNAGDLALMQGNGAIFSPCKLYRYRLWRVFLASKYTAPSPVEKP